MTSDERDAEFVLTEAEPSLEGTIVDNDLDGHLFADHFPDHLLEHEDVPHILAMLVVARDHSDGTHFPQLPIHTVGQSVCAQRVSVIVETRRTRVHGAPCKTASPETPLTHYRADISHSTVDC